MFKRDGSRDAPLPFVSACLFAVTSSFSSPLRPVGTPAFWTKGTKKKIVGDRWRIIITTVQRSTLVGSISRLYELSVNI